MNVNCITYINVPESKSIKHLQKLLLFNITQRKLYYDFRILPPTNRINFSRRLNLLLENCEDLQYSRKIFSGLLNEVFACCFVR